MEFARQSMDVDRLANLRDIINDLRDRNTISVTADGVNHYSIMQPSPSEYSGMQWEWDSCFHGMMNAHISIVDAKSEILSLNVHQIKEGADEGMYPHMVMWTERKLPQFNYQDQSWITQPPVVSIATEYVFKKDGDISFLKEMYPHLVRQEEWFARRRELNNDGLVVVLTPWETGNDQSKRFKQGLPRVTEEDEGYLEKLRIAISKDLKRYAGTVEEHQYKGDQEKARHVLNKAIIDRGGDAKRLMEDGYFIAYPADFNFIRMRSLLALANIAKELGQMDDSLRYKEKHEQVKVAVNSRLWDEETSSYRDIIYHEGQSYRPPSNYGSFLALFAHACDEIQREKIVATLSDSDRYFRKYGVSTEDVSHPESDTNDYWGANIWPQTAWMLNEGLFENGYFDLYLANTRCFSDAVIKSGPFEFFNPDNGRGLGQAFQSWTGLAYSMQANLIDRMDLEE